MSEHWRLAVVVDADGEGHGRNGQPQTAAYLAQAPPLAQMATMQRTSFAPLALPWRLQSYPSASRNSASRLCKCDRLHTQQSLPLSMASSKPVDLTLKSTVDLLAPGVSMPRLGFGIYRVQPSETAEVVLAALEAGYRHIDSAQLYNNEAELGRAVWRSEVARGDVFLTTKIRYPGMNKAKTWGEGPRQRQEGLRGGCGHREEAQTRRRGAGN